MSTETTLAQLVLAYRKAKVDLYRSSDPRIRDLLEYEENLAENLARLANLVDSAETEWAKDPAFFGTFTFMPETIRDAPAAQKMASYRQSPHALGEFALTQSARKLDSD
ncbi:hypothetical protein GS943_19040 [Rhodococcus hoagii]|nr:hypothetical protein [Prescottella equi]